MSGKPEAVTPVRPQRFDCTSGGVAYCMGCYTMTPDEDGNYVRSEDYDLLAAEVERLTKDRDVLLAAARGIQAVRDDSQEPSNACGDVLRNTLAAFTAVQS